MYAEKTSIDVMQVVNRKSLMNHDVIFFLLYIRQCITHSIPKDDYKLVNLGTIKMFLLFGVSIALY